jgi:serine O-acetyltransferase
MLKLVNSSRELLLAYVQRQLENFFPDGQCSPRALLDAQLDSTLDRMAHCIAAVRLWRAGEFDPLHSSQYATFLYFLAHGLHRNGADRALCNKLFFLNKALNGIDLFYEIEMPSVFFIGHSVGIVLAKATYGNHLVLYQNCTVGKNHGAAPTLGEGVVMYPHSAVIGDCKVGDRSVIGQGVSIVGRDTPGDGLVFQGERGDLVFARPRRDVLADIFRDVAVRDFDQSSSARSTSERNSRQYSTSTTTAVTTSMAHAEKNHAIAANDM